MGCSPGSSAARHAFPAGPLPGLRGSGASGQAGKGALPRFSPTWRVAQQGHAEAGSRDPEAS